MQDYGEPYLSAGEDLQTLSYDDEYENEANKSDEEVSLQTPIHLAIVNSHIAVVEAFIEHKGNYRLLVGAIVSGSVLMAEKRLDVILFFLAIW